MTYELLHSNVLDWAKQYTGKPYHAILCDPPYHLSSITERFSKQGSAPAQFGKDGAFKRLSKGFMSSEWDGGSVAFEPETWKAITKHLLPGGFMMAFAGTRGYHRMAVAIEDAGMIIHPAIGWAFGSGFCKATRVDDQIDSAAGVMPVKVGTKPQAGAKFGLTQALIDNGGFNDPARDDYDVTAPATDLAAAWSGHRYGLQAIKPAFEFICVAQKPYERVDCASIHAVTGWDHWCVTSELPHESDKEIARWNALQAKYSIELPASGTVYQIARKALHSGVQSDIQYWCDDVLLYTVNVKPFRAWATDNSVACMLVTRGAGSLNIDAGRIGSSGATTRSHTAPYGSGGRMDQGGTQPWRTGHDVVELNTGRWPSNLLLAHNYDCQRIGVKRIKGTNGDADYTAGTPATIAAGCAGGTIKTGRHHADDDGYEQVDEWQCSEGCAVARLGVQSGELQSKWSKQNSKPNPDDSMFGMVGTTYNEFVGDTGTAARYFFNAAWMYERLESADPVVYQAKASTAERDAGLDEMPTITVDDGRTKPIDNPHLRGETGRKNPHPTVKAVDLTKHLASLLLPPDCYKGERRLMIPFAGVASEMIGALLAGWDHVTGIELEQKHVTYGNVRLSKWTEIAERLHTSEPDVIVKALTQKPSKIKVDAGQRSLFDLVYDEVAA
jgi:hypothetical protein